MIFNICRNFAGDDRMVSIVTDNTIDEITTAGYFLQDEIVANINSINNGAFQWGENDIVFVYQPSQFLGFFTYDSANSSLVSTTPAAPGLAHNNIWIGNASNIQTAAPVSGDVLFSFSAPDAVSTVGPNFYNVSQFVPSVAFATPGDVTVLYGALRQGRSLKIGKYRKVNINIEFTPTYTTASGILFFTGFPDDVAVDLGGYIHGVGTSANLLFPVGATEIATRAVSGSRGYLVGIGSSLADSPLTDVTFGSGQIQLVQMCFEYMVA